jgi:hypothetical protein
MNRPERDSGYIAVVRRFRALIALIVFVTGFGGLISGKVSAQSMPCPAGLDPSYTECTAPVFSPYVYNGNPDLSAVKNLILQALQTAPSPSQSPTFCPGTAAYTGTFHYLCDGTPAFDGAPRCTAWGGSLIRSQILYDVQGSGPTLVYDPLFGLYLTNCIDGPLATFLSGSGIDQQRTFSCPSGYTQFGSVYEVVGTTGDPPQPTDPTVPSQTFACARKGSLQIQLSGLHEIQPGQGLAATAVVSDGAGHPMPGAIVHLRVAAVANSGGHIHGDNTDPYRLGKLSNISPEIAAKNPTGADGSFAFTYTASLVAGTYTITASCDNMSCPQVGTNSLDVKVGGLASLLPSDSYSLVGSKPWHPDNHYLSGFALLNAQTLALFFKTDPLRNTSGGVLAFNDSSLVWGGQFDVDQDWDIPHAEHRLGIVIDIRANGDTNAIPRADFKEFERLVRIMGMNFLHESVGTTNEHYHVRLLGKKG